MSKNPPYLLTALGITIAFVSCVSQKKTISTKAKLASIDSQLVQYGTTLKSIDKQRINKLEQNQIDDTANFMIQKFIDSTNADINRLHDENSIIIGTAIVNKNDWNRLVQSLIVSERTSKKINNKVLLLTDLINHNTVINLDQDVIFQPGQYTVAPAIEKAIGKFFEPAAKEIDQFIKKYPDFPLSLVITAKGYADGTAIAEGTTLYNNLAERLKLNTDKPTAKDLNKELSRARAQAVIDLFKKFATVWSANGNNVKNVLYLFEGKGDGLPDPKISDYKMDDARRRVVLLYWSVFPE